MSSYKNIVVYGAGGDNIGKFILNALIEDGSYTVSVLSRKSSKSTYSHPVQDLRVSNDLSHAELVQVLKGQDVVVSGVGFSNGALATQYKVIDAAIEAGVKRFVPSEYGFDNSDPKSAWLSPVFKVKNEVATYLDSKAKLHPDFSWSAAATGIWLEWALEVKFLDIDPVNHTVAYWDSGIHRPSHTTLPYAARGVVEILKHPEETKNKRVFMEAFVASQREIVAELEKQQGVEYDELAPIVGANVVEESHKKWESSGHTDEGPAIATVVAEILMAEYGADFVAAEKQPLVESFAAMPKVTLQDVVKTVISRSS